MVIRLRQLNFVLQTENTNLRGQVSGSLYAVSLQTTHVHYLQCSRSSHNSPLQRMNKRFDDVKSHLDKLAPRITPGYPPLGEVSGIPLIPRAEDWGDKIRFWRKQIWLDIKNKVALSEGTRSSIACLFLEDEHGHPISDEVRDAILMDIRGFWTNLDGNEDGCATLNTQDQVGFKVNEDFRIIMEGKCPWLYLCEGSWKVYQLWQNVWILWAMTPHKPGSTPPQTSGSEAEVTTGERHRSTDEEDRPGPSKNAKGKEVKREVVLATPTPCPSRPVVKKKSRREGHKSGKQSPLSSPLYVHLLTAYRKPCCIYLLRINSRLYH